MCDLSTGYNNSANHAIGGEAMPDANTFLGYRRANGAWGTRNHLLILSITGLSAPCARRIGKMLNGAVVVTVPFSGGLIGPDRDYHLRALVGLGANPNVGGIVLISDHLPKLKSVHDRLAPTGKPIVALSMDALGNDTLRLTEAGVREGATLMIELSRQRREHVPISELVLGLECGRSDPSSGLVMNPVVGLLVDGLVEAGAQVIMGETTEWIGAEHLLARRAANADVAEAIRAAALGRERAAIEAGIDLTGNNPSPTNIAAGLSTIEEKALGNTAKSGHAPIAGVLSYAQAPTTNGLFLMDAPAYSPESMTGFTAAGANLIIFTTGVGNSFTSRLAPTIKASANPQTCRSLMNQIDFDGSNAFLDLETQPHCAQRLQRLVTDVASGQLTLGEILDEGEEVISRFGPAL